MLHTPIISPYCCSDPFQQHQCHSSDARRWHIYLGGLCHCSDLAAVGPSHVCYHQVGVQLNWVEEEGKIGQSLTKI